MEEQQESLRHRRRHVRALVFTLLLSDTELRLHHSYAALSSIQLIDGYLQGHTIFSGTRTTISKRVSQHLPNQVLGIVSHLCFYLFSDRNRNADDRVAKLAKSDTDRTEDNGRKAYPHPSSLHAARRIYAQEQQGEDAAISEEAYAQSRPSR